MMIIPIVLLFLIYKKVYDIFQIAFSAFTAEGIALIFIGAAGLLFKWGTADIYPQIYAQAAGNVVKGIFVILMLLGAVLTACFIAGNVAICKKQNKNNSY